MTVASLVLTKLRIEHRGRENVISREKLLKYCQDVNEKYKNMKDDTFRHIYNKLDICVCEEGLYWPIRPNEMEDFRIYLRKKAIPLFERWKRVAAAHPHLVSNEFKQMELF